MNDITTINKTTIDKTTIDNAIALLSEIFKNHDVDDGHGIEHAIAVLKHTEKALECHSNDLEYHSNDLECHSNDLNDSVKLELKLTALLHDADDRKFFPTSKNKDNARLVLSKVLSGNTESINNIIKLIDMVSFSSNGNKHFNDNNIPEYLLYPCLADRCEAIGKIGFERSCIYSKYRNRLMYNDDTPRCTNIDELYRVASNDRLQNYFKVKESETTVDHCYDKILHLTQIEIKNPYFKKLFERGQKEMEDILLHFGKTDELNINFSV